MVTLEREIKPWKPHLGPQEDFLRLFDQVFECLFGGSKGPGKTDALVMEATRQVWHPNYHGLLIRRTYPQLQEVMDRCHQWYPSLGATWSGQERRWTFPSGATINLGSCQHEVDKYNYQGHEYQFIGFDQLEQFTESMYLYILAQIRTSYPDLVCYTRSTANPGGVGHGWVKRRFIAGKEPNEIYSETYDTPNGPISITRSFVPATIQDNPTLLQNDPHYYAYLQSLPDKERNAFLFGDWDSFEGQFFDMWNPYVHITPPRLLHPNLTRFASLDYGYTAPASVGFWAVEPIHTHIGIKNRLIRYREIYGEGYTYTELAKRIMGSLAHDESLDYIVADPSIWGDRPHHRGSTRGESGAETMQNYFYNNKQGNGKPINLMRADNNRLTGWGRMREMMTPLLGPDQMTTSLFQVFSTCKDFIRTVPDLVHDEKRPEDVNCFVAGTLISTPEGAKPIESIKNGDLVDTPIGPRKVIHSGLSGKSKTIEIIGRNGMGLEGTPNHKIFIEGKGLVELQEVRYNDIPKGRTKLCPNLLHSMALNLQREKDAVIGNLTEPSYQEVIPTFIEKSGSLCMEKSQKDTISIIEMETQTIIPLRTWNSSQRFNINQSIAEKGWNLKEISLEDYPNGENHLLGEKRFRLMPRKCTQEHLRENLRAFIVESLLRLDTNENSLAQQNVHVCEKCRHTKKNARFAESPSDIKRMDGEPLELAPINAVGFSEKIKPVYNLTVEEAHLYYANGILVTNTDGEDHAGDDARYACMSRAKASVVQPVEYRGTDGQVWDATRKELERSFKLSQGIVDEMEDSWL